MFTPARSASATLRMLDPGATRKVRSTTICGGAKSTALRRAGSKANHRDVPFAGLRVVDELRDRGVLDDLRGNARARRKRQSPWSPVVPVTSPLALSRVAEHRVPVKTATRKVPVGASSALTPGADPWGVTAQAERNAANAATGMANGNSVSLT